MGVLLAGGLIACTSRSRHFDPSDGDGAAGAAAGPNAAQSQDGGDGSSVKAGAAGSGPQLGSGGSGPQSGAGGSGPQSGAGGAGAAGGAGGSTGCTVGDVRCDALVPEQCSELGQWVATQSSCALACLDGECVECTADAVRCKDGAVQLCAAGSWSTVQLCDNACENAACVDSCTEALYQCNGDRVLQQCVGGTYVDDSQCEFLCSSGECTGECMPDTRRCNPETDNESQSCNAQGLWDESTPCESGTFCVAGDCKPCSPDSARCGPSGPQLCSDAGEWVNQGVCTSPRGVCFEGDCVLCSPGATQCAGNSVEQCAEDGSAWETAETCSGNTPACLDSTKACGACVAGATQCGNGAVQTCGDTGDWQTTQSCSGSTPRCVGGACAACDPAANERRCQTGSSFQVCTAIGSWASATTCSGDTPLCRDDLNSACGCQEGDRRCRSNTVPEVCQGGAWVAQTACAGTLSYCLPETGQCVDCVPDTTECQSGVAYQCSSTGSWESLNSCAGSGINCGGCDLGEDCSQDSDCSSGVCVGGACAECRPSATECVGVTPRVCTSGGTWLTQPACSGTTPQCLPSSGSCVECLSGTRTCGTCQAGSQTCTNNAWGTCVGDTINLQSDEAHCGSCNTQCGSLEACQSGMCACGSGSHECGGTCYTLTDGSACGPTCLDCAQYHGTTGSCISDQCVCDGASFACGANVPTCGTWTFDTGTLEGWKLGSYKSPYTAIVSGPAVGTNGASQALALGIDTSLGTQLSVQVPLCPNSTAVSFSNPSLSFDVTMSAGSGSAQLTGIVLADGYMLNCQFTVQSGQTLTYSACGYLPASISNLEIFMNVSAASWTGNVYIDNVRLFEG